MREKKKKLVTGAKEASNRSARKTCTDSQKQMSETHSRMKKSNPSLCFFSHSTLLSMLATHTRRASPQTSRDIYPT